MENKKVYIYSRITTSTSEDILDYQTNILKNYAIDHRFEIAYMAYSINESLFEADQLYRELISMIENELIDALLIWSPHRITLSAHKYEEFEMFCLMHKVEIISYR